MRWRSLVLATLLTPLTVVAGDYTLETIAADEGGLRGISANYTLDASLAAGGAGQSADYTARTGFAGQLRDPLDLTLGASQLSVSEGATTQLSAALRFDDGTSSPLDASTVGWSGQNPPLAGISAGGLVTASPVYQTTGALVGGSYAGFTGTLNLNVINTNLDNYGSYAGDGLDDAWQVQYFGLNNVAAAPARDPDGDGQNNLFEFTAGLLPTNATSRFKLFIDTVPGQPTQRRLIFSPLVAGRTYTIESRAALTTGSWAPLGGTSQSDNGTVRTVTVSGVTGAQQFYRVRVSAP